VRRSARCAVAITFIDSLSMVMAVS
jgi:hypothetical protein